MILGDTTGTGSNLINFPIPRRREDVAVAILKLRKDGLFRGGAIGYGAKIQPPFKQDNNSENWMEPERFKTLLWDEKKDWTNLLRCFYDTLEKRIMQSCYYSLKDPNDNRNKLDRMIVMRPHSPKSVIAIISRAKLSDTKKQKTKTIKKVR